ncbi:MAG: TRAP transporter fused permease subunit [Aeropyrum sp.]|nr:TRAP transporter fused permease subunit [Aeropyrum sp.]
MGEDSLSKSGIWARRLLVLVSIIYTLGLLYYYYSGRGGPILLASIYVPLSVSVALLIMYLDGGPVRRLPKPMNALFVLLSFALSAVISYYIVTEFEELNTIRFGSYNTADILVGGSAFLMVMIATFLKYRAIFALNALLLLYTLNGSWAPYPFDHPGIRPERIVTAMSVEFETGVFEKLSQLSLTLIGAFMLFISIAQSFGAVESIVRLVISTLGRRRELVPQAAVIGSMVIAMVSGSGAANAASTGSITIPLMKRAGVPPVKAAAIETASSIGGQLMPPIMGISAFVMADYLGVSYFDVIARGWAPAIVYYLGVAAAVFVVSLTLMKGQTTTSLEGSVRRVDVAKTASLLASVLLLIFLMGVRRDYPAYAALQSSLLLLALLASIDAAEARSLRKLYRLIVQRIENIVTAFVGFVTDITILLSALGVMTGLMTITGIPTRVGFLLLEMGGGNIVLLVGLAFVFGYLVGLGLPPVVTYILTVVVIGPYLLQAGINPWIIHFYAFFLGVMSELSPPTSVTAAVTSRIAGASFFQTMMESLRVSIPLFILMAAVFVKPDLVIEPGARQVLAVIQVSISTILVVLGLGGIHRNPVLRIASIAAGLALLLVI